MSTLTQETNLRRATFAQVAGRAPEQVRTYQLELNVLREQGILVDLNISGVTMFERKVEWDEIGFQPGGADVRKQRISTGRKIILPVDGEIRELHSIAATLRQTLARYSCDIPGFYPYKFVTLEAFQRQRCDPGLEHGIAQFAAQPFAHRAPCRPPVRPRRLSRHLRHLTNPFSCVPARLRVRSFA